MKVFILATALACLMGNLPALAAVERLWTGINGKSFRGSLHHLAADRTNAEFLSTDGKLLTVALANLIPDDREWILNPSKPSPGGPAAAGDMSQFKPVASPNRKLTPLLDPKTVGCRTDHSLVDALWISLLWWDQTGVVPIPKNGDLESKAEWLHKRLTRAVVKGGDSVSAEDAKKGVEQYFSEELEKAAACRITIEQQDFSAVRLAGFLQGSNAVVMLMSMQYENGRDFAVGCVLESMDEDGKFVFHMFGRRFSGQLKPMDGKKPAAPGSVPSEYVLDQPQDRPDHYAQNGARFFMGPAKWNAAVVLKPYVYLTPGKVVPLPADGAAPTTARKPEAVVQ